MDYSDIDNYKKTKFAVFVKNYEIALVYEFDKCRHEKIQENTKKYGLREDEEWENQKQFGLDIKDIEKFFLLQILKYFNKRHRVIIRYMRHCIKINKNMHLTHLIEPEYSNHDLKMQFVDFKLSKINVGIEVEKFYYNASKPKENKNGLYEGKRFNLNERYEIAKTVFNIDGIIRTLNITDMEKYKLLGLFFDCNETNARHIMNNQYPGKIRKDLIQNYLNTLFQKKLVQ